MVIQKIGTWCHPESPSFGSGQGCETLYRAAWLLLHSCRKRIVLNSRNQLRDPEEIHVQSVKLADININDHPFWLDPQQNPKMSIFLGEKTPMENSHGKLPRGFGLRVVALGGRSRRSLGLGSISRKQIPRA